VAKEAEEEEDDDRERQEMPSTQPAAAEDVLSEEEIRSTTPSANPPFHLLSTTKTNGRRRYSVHPAQPLKNYDDNAFEIPTKGR
jgi:hypothetical protein